MTKTVYDLKENGKPTVMESIDAHHAVSVDPKRWSFVDPNAKEPQKIPSTDDKLDELWQELQTIKARLDILTAPQKPAQPPQHPYPTESKPV